MGPTKVLALILAGGNGARLHPLTAEHAKPALPFAAGYRIVDFVLSNLVNSGISSIYVLAQYKPRSLVEHISAVWAPWRDGERFIEVLLPETNGEAGSFKGTADAVYQNLHLIERHRPDLVAVFAADHIYRMDVRQMVSFHQHNAAEVSIAAVPVPLEEGTEFGIIVTAQNGRVEEFQEKPERPVPIPDDPNRAYASMGNYLFNPRVLVALLEEASRRGDTDFGSHIMPRLPGRCGAFAYDFANNKIPGIRPHEERGYWRDVGTLDAYLAAQRDVLDPMPRFNLENPQWPIRGGGHCVWTAQPNNPRLGESDREKRVWVIDQSLCHR
jgi:glucose-1-phosphate adenylyltransferase